MLLQRACMDTCMFKLRYWVGQGKFNCIQGKKIIIYIVIHLAFFPWVISKGNLLKSDVCMFVCVLRVDILVCVYVTSCFAGQIDV